jgi:hypothetical protein
MTAHRLAVQTLLVRKLEQWRVAESKRGYRWGYRKFCESYEFNIYKALQASFNRPQPNTLKANPNRLAFFSYYRVFAPVPAGSCGLRRESSLPATGRFYSPFSNSLSDPPHPAQGEVRKAYPSPLYKSMTYARTNQAVYFLALVG